MKVKDLLEALEPKEHKTNILGYGKDHLVFSVSPILLPEYEYLGELGVKSFEIHMNEDSAYDVSEKIQDNEGALIDVTDETVIVIAVKR